MIISLEYRLWQEYISLKFDDPGDTGGRNPGSALAGCGKTLRSPFDKLRANGSPAEFIDNFPFMLGLSKHGKLFFRNLLEFMTNFSEPSALLLVGSGLVGLWGCRKKFREYFLYNELD